MGYFASPTSISASKQKMERTRLLVSVGKSFNLEGKYDFARILKWMKDSYEALAHFPEEQDEFGLFCLNSYAFPKDRVRWGVQILEQALQKIALQRVHRTKGAQESRFSL